ncbi:MAG TPA: trypsin-like peptidase domain-containing protein [Candidatus Hydrogenedentes bacterium]|nr:trypsin-like peptidase domain-containing protein [Candidatus Hydrogenedentota bacterium]
MKKTTWALVAACLAAFVVVAPAWGAPSLVKELEDTFIRIGQEVRPCVVNIEAVGVEQQDQMQGLDREKIEDFFKFWGIPVPQDGGRPRPRTQVATGSGFVYDKQGHIITNNHVVANAKSLKVHFWDDTILEATVVGRDPDSDVAVIKVNPSKELQVARLGDSDALKTGQFVIAFGSPRGLEGSLSFGHVSALGREKLAIPGLRFFNLIQTDAAINLGNSGGPLVNIDGEVIGINTAIVWGAQSLGFAVPINTAKKLVPTLISEGKVTRGYLGVRVRDVKEFADSLALPDAQGAFVEMVSPGTPAERAGLKPYDVIRKVNDETIATDTDLVNKISDIRPGQKTTLEVWRDGKAISVEVTPTAFPGEEKIAAAEKSGILGITVRPLGQGERQAMGLDASVNGVLIDDIEPASPAEEAGLAPGNIITEIAKQPVSSVEEFQSLIRKNAKAGSSLLVRVYRENQMPSILVIKVPQDYKN